MSRQSPHSRLQRPPSITTDFLSPYIYDALRQTQAMIHHCAQTRVSSRSSRSPHRSQRARAQNLLTTPSRAHLQYRPASSMQNKPTPLFDDNARETRASASMFRLTRPVVRRFGQRRPRRAPSRASVAAEPARTLIHARIRVVRRRTRARVRVSRAQTPRNFIINNNTTTTSQRTYVINRAADARTARTDAHASRGRASHRRTARHRAVRCVHDAHGRARRRQTARVND